MPSAHSGIFLFTFWACSLIRVSSFPRCSIGSRRVMSVTALGRSSLSSFPLLAGRPLLLLPRRRAPGAPAPQQNDPGRCDAHFDPIGALPALLPARVVADLWVEPDAGVFGLEHPFIRRVVLWVVQRRSRRAAVDGVARAKRLHRRRARTEGAGDPLVAAVLVHPTADVVCELPERNPLIYSHVPHRPLFCGSRLRRWLRPPLRHPSGGRGSSPLPFLLGTGSIC